MVLGGVCAPQKDLDRDLGSPSSTAPREEVMNT